MREARRICCSTADARILLPAALATARGRFYVMASPARWVSANPSATQSALYARAMRRLMIPARPRPRSVVRGAYDALDARVTICVTATFARITFASQNPLACITFASQKCANHPAPARKRLRRPWFSCVFAVIRTMQRMGAAGFEPATSRV